MVFIDMNENESECLIRHIEEQMSKRKGIVILFTGQVGDGKSYSGLRFLEIWQKKHFNERFSAEHICKDLEQAISLIMSFERLGEGVLVEELSVLAGVRDSLTNANKLWNKFLDMCRIKQAIIVANAPHKNFIDKHFFLMCQAWVNCIEVQFKKKIVVAKPLWINPVSYLDKPYTNPYISPETWHPITHCYFRHPQDKELVKKYNEIKMEGFIEHSEDNLLKFRKDKQEKLKLLGHKFLPPREREAYELYLKGYNSKEGAKKMDISRRVYQQHVKSSKDKFKSLEYQRELKLLNERREKNEKKLLTHA